MILERYKLINDCFLEKVNFEEKKVNNTKKDFFLINNSIPNFVNGNLDELTEDISNFYNEIKFPNYDDCDDYASLYDKGTKNIFTKRLDEELGYGSRILELGCGTGQLSLFLSRSNREIFAVDISNGSLLLGEEFRKKNNIQNTFFMKMDVFNLQFKDNIFDTVVTNGVLHHTKDSYKAFKCLLRVLKPNGIIVVGLYHKYGRSITRLKQKLAKIIGNKVAYLDKTSLKIKSEGKRNAWVRDQFLNPHETLHTPNEVIKWFDNNNIEFLNLIPHYSIEKQRLIKKNPKPKISLIQDLMLAFDSKQIQEGGFFVMIGRKL